VKSVRLLRPARAFSHSGRSWELDVKKMAGPSAVFNVGCKWRATGTGLAALLLVNAKETNQEALAVDCVDGV